MRLALQYRRGLPLQRCLSPSLCNLLHPNLYPASSSPTISVEKVLTIVYQPQSVFRIRPVNRCSATIAGHTEAVLSVAFSPDGQQLASGSGDTTVRLWDLNTQTPMFNCTGHKNWVLCIAWSPDGKHLVSGSKAGELICLDPKTGKQSGNSLLTIKVRIIRLWDAISYRSLDELATHFILLDEQDNQSLALAPSTERARLSTQIHEGVVYYITDFKIVVGPAKWNPIVTERALIFCQQTKIRLCYDGYSIAKFKFELCPLPAISKHLGKFSNLIDICGVVYNVGNIKHNSYGVQRLNIQLMDESGAVATISLWGARTQQFDIAFTIHRKRNVVMVVTGLLVRHNNGHMCLVSTPATKFYFDPSYKKLSLLGDIVASKYGEFVCRLPLTEIYEDLYPISVQRIYLNLQEMKTPVKWVQPKLYKRQSFFCKVTIMDILSSEEWCFRPVDIDDLPDPSHRVYRCRGCNVSFIPTSKRSKTILLVADSTQTAKLTMNSPELEQLTGLSMMQLMTDCVDKHVKYREPLQSEIRSIKDVLCTFEVEATPCSATGSIKEITIKSIVESIKLVKKRKADRCLTQLGEKQQCRAIRQ